MGTEPKKEEPGEYAKLWKPTPRRYDEDGEPLEPEEDDDER